jgi:hypothetical protein
MGARAGKGAETATAAEEEAEEVLLGVRKGKERKCTSAST